MQTSVSFVLDGKLTTLDFKESSGITPTTTVLNYLRSLPTHKGVKEACAEGDCGACTVVLGEPSGDGGIHYRNVDSCLVFLPMIHGKQLITVENLKNEQDELHPVQQQMVETGGSQCGYCTPGIVMSLFALYKNYDHPSREDIDNALTGNLCRCTGYKPIIEAAAKSCVHRGQDHFNEREPEIAQLLESVPDESIHLQTPTQRYYRPKKMSEAILLKTQNPDSVILCGGTDVALRLTKKHEMILTVIDLSAVDDLKKINEDNSSVEIGAAVPLNDVMTIVKNSFPALHDMLSVFGSQQIRNLATLGGNLGTASPIGDTLPVLMAYNARVVLESKKGRREVGLDDFFIGYRQTVRRPDELISSIILPKNNNRAHVRSYKISKRKDLDIATLSAGFRLELDEGSTVAAIKLAYGGMAERTKRATTVEQFLTGRTWNRKTIEQAMPIVDDDFTPISDVRGGAAMRRIAAKNLLLKFWVDTVRIDH